MSQDNETSNLMRAITLSREYGSGGGEIATRLAIHLGWRLVDHEIVERVASEMGTTIQEAEARDERTEGFLERAFNGLQSSNQLSWQALRRTCCSQMKKRILKP